MKIERLSENQIRCTLYKNDLIDHELKLSELAYGTEKAKNFFKEMMTQASYELGFEAHDIPLIIEAVPVSADCIILIVTKVEDPEELDTRFSKFSPTPMDILADESEADVLNDNPYTRADDILDLFQRVSKRIASKLAEEAQDGDTLELDEELSFKEIPIEAPDEDSEPLFDSDRQLQKVFSFASLAYVTALAERVDGLYNGSNTLYKNLATEVYYLTMNLDDHTPADFNKTCNMATEYGQSVPLNYGTIAFYEEHFKVIIRDRALQVLSHL